MEDVAYRLEARKDPHRLTACARFVTMPIEEGTPWGKPTFTPDIVDMKRY